MVNKDKMNISQEYSIFCTQFFFFDYTQSVDDWRS